MLPGSASQNQSQVLSGAPGPGRGCLAGARAREEGLSPAGSPASVRALGQEKYPGLSLPLTSSVGTVPRWQNPGGSRLLREPEK